MATSYVRPTDGVDAAHAMLSGTVLRTQSDARLAALAATGTEAAFEAIVVRHQRDLVAYASRLLRSDTRGEDAAQQALLSAWTALRRGAEVRELKPWLYRITHNQAVSTLRRAGEEAEPLSETLADSGGVDAELERRMLVRQTFAALAALPDGQRQAILRTAVDGRSYAEAAEAMGVSDHALRGLAYRARQTMRAAVGAACPAPLVA